MQKTKTKPPYKTGRKAHGVIEAAHFAPDGSLAWVRAYERRGPTWSDLVLLDRAALMERVRRGKRFFVGKRIESWASEFELGQQLRLKTTHRGTFLVLGEGRGDLPNDQLDGIPVV
jgi:hypothetical protein